MKRLLLALLFCATFLTSPTQAQVVQNIPSPGTLTGQLLIPNKTYTGTFIDTFTNAGTYYLTIVSGRSGSTANPLDTAAIWGSGLLQISFTETKISGAPYGNARIECSPDGVKWYPAAYYPNTNYQDTTIIDSLAGSRSRTYNVVKTMPYYRLKVILTGTQSTSWVSQYFLQREQIMSISK